MSEEGDEGDGDGGRRRFNPSIQVPVLKIILAITVGGPVGYLLLQQLGFGENTWNVAVLLAVIVSLYVINKVIEIVVLLNTEYVITEDTLIKRFSLLYRTNTREIPIEKIRGVEHNQGMIATLLGVGTLVILTAGPNRSLGFLEFQHIAEPETRHDTIKDLMLEGSTDASATTPASTPPISG